MPSHCDSIPPELKDIGKKVDVAVDIIYVNMVPFAASVSRNLKFKTAEHITNRQNTLIDSIKINHYKKCGFKLYTLNIDV